MTPLLPMAEIGWSPELRVTRASGACEMVLGRPAERLVGLPLTEVLRIGPVRARSLENRAREADAPALEFLTHVEPGHAGEPHVYRLTLSRDAQGESHALVLHLSKLLEGAPPVQVSRLSSSLSHEIRNPLSSVKMAVQTLQRNQDLNDRDKRRLSIANREIRTMERMLWLFSEYGREMPPHVEHLPLRTVINEAADMVGPELAERGCSLALRIDGCEEAALPKVWVDLARTRPVLAQVLLNVAMGQPPGTVVEVVLRAAPEGGSQLVLVDSVAALPPDERATLFEPFGSRLARGAGLSLASLRRLMRSQGGDVFAEGSELPGATFRLAFPADRPEGA